MLCLFHIQETYTTVQYLLIHLVADFSEERDLNLFVANLPIFGGGGIKYSKDNLGNWKIVADHC